MFYIEIDYKFDSEYLYFDTKTELFNAFDSMAYTDDIETIRLYCDDYMEEKTR